MTEMERRRERERQNKEANDPFSFPDRQAGDDGRQLRAHTHTYSHSEQGEKVVNLSATTK